MNQPTLEELCPCHIWPKYKDRQGYGRVKQEGKMRFAHRVIYEQTFGEIPDGFCVLHKCDNPSCVNPEHLFLGTRNDNIQDMLRKGRWNFRGSEHPLAKLTRTQILAIRKSTKTQKELAREFNVSETSICDIRKERRYKV